MKLSDDQKRIGKALAIYPICYIATIVIYHTIKGNADWEDIVLHSIAAIVVSVLLALFFICGSKTPEK